MRILLILLTLLCSNANAGIFDAVISQYNAAAFPNNATVLDDFNRSDAAPMTGWVDVVNGFGTAGTVAVPTTVDAVNWSLWNTSYSNNVSFALTLATKGAATDAMYLSVMSLTDGTSGYIVKYTVAAGTDVLSLEEVSVSGNPTEIGTPVNIELSAGDKIGVKITTSGIIYVYTYASGAWTLRITQADSTWSAPFYPGMLCYSNTSRFDDLTGGSY